MRYLSPRIAPGVSPPAGIESDEMRRPTPTAAATCAGAAPGAVTICETDLIACPQEEQNRLLAGFSARHDGQWIVGAVT